MSMSDAAAQAAIGAAARRTAPTHRPRGPPAGRDRAAGTADLPRLPRRSTRSRDRAVFRDLLRTEAALADEYAALKTRAAAKHPDHREAYTSQTKIRSA